MALTTSALDDELLKGVPRATGGSAIPNRFATVQPGAAITPRPTNNTDSFGVSGDPLGYPGAVSAPDDPRNQPNPRNPGGISDNELFRRQNVMRDASVATANINDQRQNPNTISQSSSVQQQVDAYMHGNIGGVTGAANATNGGWLPGTGPVGGQQGTPPGATVIGSPMSALGGARPEDAINPGANARGVAQQIGRDMTFGNTGVSNLQNQIRTGGAGFEQGAGSAGISAVDQALTGYNPNAPAMARGSMGSTPGQVSMNALPGAVRMEALPGMVDMAQLPGRGSMGALPGTGQMGALPGTASMGALPGATDRDIQLSQLDRILAYNPETSSRAEAMLRDASEKAILSNLSMAGSARGGVAARSQAQRRAQQLNAGAQSQAARDMAILRATEEDTAKQRELGALDIGSGLSTGIRGADVGERAQNVSALESALGADVTQRGQTIGALETERTSGVAERGQTIGAKTAERQAGVAERGQEVGAIEASLASRTSQRGQDIGALEAALASGTTQRGQDVGALEAELNAGVAQRGQNIDQTVAERNAGVSERGQDITAQSAAQQRELDAIRARGDLATAERNAGVQERGQNINATTSLEQTKVARDAISASALTDAEKIASNELINKAQLGYQLTLDERIRLAQVTAELAKTDPTAAQIMGGIIQGAATGAITGGAVAGPVGAAVGGVVGAVPGIIDWAFG